MFANVKDATRALSWNGHTLLGKKIVVRSSATGRNFSTYSSFLQVAASFLSLPEAKRGIRQKSAQICGVDLKKFRFVKCDDRNWCCLTSGTQ
jgi:hypothetical protein